MNSAALLELELEVASPCVNVCRMSDASGYCEGCRRSLDEIARWVLSWGGGATVLKPAELAEMVRRSAKKLLQNGGCVL